MRLSRHARNELRLYGFSLEDVKFVMAAPDGSATATTRARIAREQPKLIVALPRQILALHTELDVLTVVYSPMLREPPGCGPLTAAILIGQDAGVKRFATDAKFARQAGTAPIPARSGRTQPISPPDMFAVART